MPLQSINPATGQETASFPEPTAEEADRALAQAERAFQEWSSVSFAHRAAVMRQAAAYLREHKTRLATVITSEMGKAITEAEAEVVKCAWNCDFYAENAERFLTNQPVETDARRSYVAFDPLGVVLAVMPWNFPFWQVFRFAAPALMAGNTALLKHAANVPQCALAIHQVFADCGFPPGVFTSLLLRSDAVARVIADPRVKAVTLTGSDLAGAKVAEVAGRHLKKSVLELGGSDPFIVLGDADVAAAAATAVRARCQNAGQSCIAAKRFIVHQAVAEEFEERFKTGVEALKVGDPMDYETQVGPLAREDLLEDLDRQVRDSLARGARLLTGGSRLERPGYFYAPTVLADVTPGMPAWDEETFGPVAAVVRAADADEAIRLANDSIFGLGANLWTRDLERGEALARRIESGNVFINGMVKSDPRLPFGGVKRSGWGRELSEYGIREFVNIKTVWVA